MTIRNTLRWVGFSVLSLFLLLTLAGERLLSRWDGNMKADLVAPLIFVAWMCEFERELLAPQLGDDFARYWAPHALLLQRLLSGGKQDCGGANCLRLLSQSLRTALRGLRDRLGSKISGWRWGRLHRADFWSIVSRAPLFGGLLSDSVPVGGGEYTIDAGYMKFAAAKHPYRADIGPGLRMILDLSDLSNSRFIIAAGMSGDALSPHYGDLMQRWRDFRYIDIEHEAARHTLRLLPGRRAGDDG